MIDNRLAPWIAPRYLSLMVNVRPEMIAANPPYLNDLLNAGVGLFRINAAFGSHRDWMVVRSELDRINHEKSHSGKLMLDLAGPKNRVEELSIDGKPVDALPLRKGQFVFLSSESTVQAGSLIQCSDHDFLSRAKAGELIRFDDARVEGILIAKQGGVWQVEVKRVFGHAYSLAVGKGINFPETNTSGRGLSAKDSRDLEWAAKYADVVSFSFTRSGDEVRKFRELLVQRNRSELAMNIKIETREAMAQLSSIMAACVDNPPCSVMIARGDIVSEGGPSMLGIWQERIMEEARKARLPLFLATGVLDSFIQSGFWNRSELSDRYFLRSIDAFLLDQGPYLLEAIRLWKEMEEKISEEEA